SPTASWIRGCAAREVPLRADGIRTGRMRRWLDSDVGASWRSTPSAIGASVVLAVIFLGALLASWLSPQDPYDLTQLMLAKSELPPIWQHDGEWPYLLGTDTQGRDLLSAILYGSRVSLIIGFASVAASMSLGVTLGLVAGFKG